MCIPRQQIGDDCVSSRSPARLAFSADDGYMHIHTPPRDCYRFTFEDYAALSYVWGDERETRKILVNDQKIQVTRNLEQALKTFRNRSKFQDGFGLWEDATCINQYDVEERGRQVQKMREIYEKAWTVITWLGENAQASRLQDHEPAHSLEVRLRKDPAYLGEGSRYALNELMPRPYWYRLRIIQQIIMGASSSVIQCGDCSIDWGTFCTGFRAPQEHLWFVKNRLLQIDARDETRNLRREEAAWWTTSLHFVYRELSVLTRMKQPTALLYWRILDIASASARRDPRDKVYGLVASSSNDKTVRLWDTATGAPLQTLEGHSYAVNSVAFSPDGTQLPVLRVVNYWLIEGSANILWLPTDYRPTCEAVWGKIIVLGHASGRLSFLQIQQGPKLIT